MSELTTLRIAELSTLSNITYSAQLTGSIYGWTVLPEYSKSLPNGLSYMTFIRGKEIVISFEGTNSFSDVPADSSFFFRSWDSQFEDAAKAVAEIKSKFTGYSFDVTGHSLGGGIAQIISKMFGMRGASFEAPGAEGVTDRDEFKLAQQNYAEGFQSNEPVNFLNYTAQHSLISGVGSHVGDEVVISPYGATMSPITLISIAALFVGGPVGFLGLIGLGIGNISRLHPIANMERFAWVKALLENELSISDGTLDAIVTTRSQVPDLMALGGNPNDQVTLYKNRFTKELAASLTKEGEVFVLRSSDMREKVTITNAEDGGFDCKIERQGEPITTCRLRFDGSNTPVIEVDTNNDNKADQLIESGRADDGNVYEKISYFGDDNAVISTVEHRESDDGLKKIDLFDRDADGLIEQRRTTFTDDSGNETLSVQNFDAKGEASSELVFHTDSERKLTVYELIVNEKSEDIGFITQPVDDELISRLVSARGVMTDLRGAYAYGGTLVDTLTVADKGLVRTAHQLATRFTDTQLQEFLQNQNSDSLGAFPSLVPSDQLTAAITRELLQLGDKAWIDVRFNLDNDMLLVSSGRMVSIRSDGSILRQTLIGGGAQEIVNIDPDGYVGSVVTTMPAANWQAGSAVSYQFRYRNATSATLTFTVMPDLGQAAKLVLDSNSLKVAANYLNGHLTEVTGALIDGRALSEGALKVLASQMADLSPDEAQAAFAGLQSQALTGELADPSTQRLSAIITDVKENLVAVTDNVGNLGYVIPAERNLQAIGDKVSTFIDGLTLLRALKAGQPLPIVASGLRLVSAFDMLDGTRDLPNVAGAASALLSLYGLANALKEGDAAGAISSAAFASAGFLQTAQSLANSGVIAPLEQSTKALAGSLNNALPYINLVNSIAHGDTTGVAVAVADIALINAGAYTVPVIGWAYAIYSLVDALFTEVPDPWGNARFVWRDGALAVDSAGETGGEQAVNNVMQAVLSSMNALIERERQQNPGSQLGIIANRMPGLIMAMDGYRFTDIDALTGAERHPALRYDTNGRPYNAAAGSPESFMGLVEAIIRSGLAREAIAPSWEVRTAELQTLAGDPKAGLREEERAGIDGQLAASVDGDTQVFRPVVLDLDDDGIDKIARATGVLFDVDNSGFRKRTAWVAADDAFLVFDRNYNGLIDSGREMFSNALVALARRGLAGMAWTDANYDGRITVVDPVWEEIRLWRDANNNGQQDGGEGMKLGDLGITELNYAMGTYTRDGQLHQMSSPNLDADAQGIRVNVVPQGVLIESSEDSKLSLLVTRIDDKTAVEPGRDGAGGIEDVEILVNGADLLANDLLGGFSGRQLTLESLNNFRHGTGFIDPNGVIHFQPEANYDGNDAGFDYIARAINGQAGKGSVDISLAPVNDAPTLGKVDNQTRPVYGYTGAQVDPESGAIHGGSEPIYAPWTEITASGAKIVHDAPMAQEPTGLGKVIGKDIDDAASGLSYELVSQPQYGSVSLDASGAFSYTSWKAPDTPSDRVLLDGQYAAWKDGVLYNASNIHGRAVYPDTDAFQVQITDPHGATSVVTVNVPHLGPYLPPTPPGGGGKKPISIDLDGDGFEFVNVDDSTIFFDVTGDGWKRRTSWIGKDDGILAVDIDGDGKIDKPGEIAFAPNASGAQTDLEGLAAFDTHRDGQFDANDRDWSRFGIWQDSNQNGVTDPGEFRKLDQLGVQAVQLGSDGRFQVINGQTVHGIGQLQLKDGRTLAMADVTLAFSQERQLANGKTLIPDSPFSPSGAPIEGTDGADLIPGRNGSDVIRAYGGDDMIIDDVGNDVVFAGDGNDTAFTGADNDFIDAGAGDDYVQAGLGNDVAFGGDGNDVVFLQQGNDIAFGGHGDDLIAGEEGNDVLSGDDGNDQLFGGDGTDVLFGRAGDDQLYGLSGDDQLDGGDGHDLLDGGLGADGMKGGAGDDTYGVDDPDDSVTESDDAGNDSGGRDTVKTTLDGYRLGERIEDLELIDVRQSFSPRVGYGNSLANHITGNSEANLLYGEGGDDRIDGGFNADLMAGGQGNDLYIVDNEQDRVVELDGEGADVVMSSVSYTLPDAVENLDLTGKNAISAKGNALDNRINGNAGANLIDGGLGADTMAGGLGDDTYRINDANDRVVEDKDEGIDTVIASLDWRVDDNAENLILGGSQDLKAWGNELDNLLRGNRGSNLLAGGSGSDTLAGAEGSDVLDGGDGSDLYLYNSGDGLERVLDASGRDRIRFGAGITSDQVSVRVVDTGHGIQAQLRFIDANGDEGRQEGIDFDLHTIDEFEFADGRVLGFGDLLTRTRVRQAGPKEVGLTGDRSDDIIYGNNRNNKLNGGSGNDALFGDGGYDTLTGGGGNDFLAGGNKDDIIITGSGYNVIAFNHNDGRDTVVTSAGAVNTLSLGQGIALSDLSLRRAGKDLMVDIGNKDGVTLKDWYASAAHRNLETLQLIAPSNGNAAPSITRIDFDGLAAQFDAANGVRANSPWQAMKAKLDAHLSKGTMAIGDELAFDYAQHGRFDLSASAISGAMYRLDPALAAQKLASPDSYRA